LLSFNALSDQKIFDQLFELTRNVRRAVPECEINDAIAKVRGTESMAQGASMARGVPTLEQTPFEP
jgi:hypothetical protein